MAEREGFEPPELSLNGFQDRRLKPLGHLSVLGKPIAIVESQVSIESLGY
jgi:hypothetical protein